MSHGAMRLDKARFSQEREKRKRHFKEVTCLQVTLAVLLMPCPCVPQPGLSALEGNTTQPELGIETTDRAVWEEK